MRALLFFDLLGVSALNRINVNAAASTLNQLSLVLETVCRTQEWEFGFHLSDSTFLVAKDLDKAILQAAALWKHFFLHDIYGLNSIAVHPMDALGENERWE